MIFTYQLLTLQSIRKSVLCWNKTIQQAPTQIEYLSINSKQFEVTLKDALLTQTFYTSDEFVLLKMINGL
jgi:hypothetical protein